MDESIETGVLVGDDEKVLKLIIDEELVCFTLLIDGKVVCRGDWKGNLKKFFERTLELWRKEDD